MTVISSQADTRIGQQGYRPTRGRLAIVAVMLLGLLGAMGTRHLADGMRRAQANAAGGGQSLGSLNSFTLGLLLGGLRGPLVMVLWSSSEESKNAKNLEDFDTKLEFIRMLQPEFMRVHIYQMWNKAYNISVQRASKANKYADILDAIEYGDSVGRQFPDNINIVAELGRLWGDKLGGDMQQRSYYYRRVCDETKWRVLKNNDVRRSGSKPLELAPRLDPDGNILPRYRQELQYLVPFEPFPDGISPQAMGYNYLKWAQELQGKSHQRHLDMSAGIISSRPAMGLKIWAQNELDRGRRLELLAFMAEQARLDIDRSPLQMMTADAPLTAQIKDRAAFDEDLRKCARARQVQTAALKEYQRHIASEFGGDEWTYRSHIDDVNAELWLATADEAYLEAMITPDAQRKQSLIATATTNYRKALDQFRRIVLRYYTDDEIAAGLYQKHAADPRSSLPVLSQMDSAALSRLYAAVLNQVRQMPYDPNAENRSEYEGFLGRCSARLEALK